MTHQFCTSCGHSVVLDARFCEECGAVFETVELPSLQRLPDTKPTGATSGAITRSEVVKHARSVVSTWVIPFNATLVFGTTMAAVFDFLSPRVALLPIAATVAVAGLLTALALRKFVAPSLPPSSAFRRLLAPETELHKSPMLIATGLLSALMVSGAAWSSAASASGGVIASKFDMARNVQMQLGVMQGLQKEQRVQTAVLEDIREGRAVDPRRELNNIGGGFSGYELDAALDRGDLRTVKLLLAGGLKWRISNAYAAFANTDPAMSKILLENMENFESRSGDCEQLIEQKFGADELFLRSGGVIASSRVFPGKHSATLEPFQKSLLKKFCDKAEVQAFVKEKLINIKEKLSNEQQKFAAASVAELQRQQKLNHSREICVVERNAQRPYYLRRQQYKRRYSDSCSTSDCSNVEDKLIEAAHDGKKYAETAQTFCSEQYSTVPKFARRVTPDMSPTYQQILLTYQQVLDSIS